MLSNGKEEKGTSWETTPGSIARAISKSLFERTVISLVDGELWDLTRPLEKSCKLELLDFEHIEGRKIPLPVGPGLVYWALADMQ